MADIIAIYKTVLTWARPPWMTRLQTNSEKTRMVPAFSLFVSLYSLTKCVQKRRGFNQYDVFGTSSFCGSAY